MKKNILWACFLIVALLACGKNDGPARVRAAICPSMPPNAFEENGTYRGIDLELFEGFCRTRGYRCSVTAYDWQGMISAVAGGQADVAFSALSITDKRREVIDFSKPYMENAWHLVSLPGRNVVLRDLAELKKYSIGYARGMAYSQFIREDLEPKGIYRLKDARLYPNVSQAMADLKNGNLDMVFLDASVAAAYKKKNFVRDSYVFTGVDYFGFAFPKGSPLRDDFDRYLTEMGPEKVRAIVDRWM